MVFKNTQKKFFLILLVLTAVFLAVLPAYSEEKEKRPIVLVPGLAASWNWKVFLGGHTDKWDWAPGADKFYSSLISRFAKEGYSQANELFTVAYYDWRKPLSESSQQLKATIAAVKSNTGSDKVDIISHSMGGLVTRAYIQSDDYANDVGKFITMGTPHLGVANAYFPWEGKDAYGWETNINIVFGIYTEIYGIFHEELNTIDKIHTLFPGLRDLLPIYYQVSNDVMPIFAQASSGFLNKLFPPVFALLEGGNPFFLPSHTFYLLDENTGTSLLPNTTLYAENENLNKLYQNSLLLFDRVEDFLNIIGLNRDTMLNIFVKPNLDKNGLYPDGIPNKEKTGYPDNGKLEDGETIEGDGTVAGASALPPLFLLFGKVYLAEDDGTGKGVNHTALPGNPNVQKEIFNFLGINYPTGDFPSPAIADSLIIYAASPVNLTITAPEGKIINQSINQIEDAEYITSGGDKPITIIILPVLRSGNYQIQVTGTGQGEYHLGAAYFSDTTTTPWVATNGTTQLGQINQYEFSLDKNQTEGDIVSSFQQDFVTPSPTPNPNSTSNSPSNSPLTPTLIQNNSPGKLLSNLLKQEKNLNPTPTEGKVLGEEIKTPADDKAVIRTTTKSKFNLRLIYAVGAIIVVVSVVTLIKARKE